MTTEKPGFLASFLRRLGLGRTTPQAWPYHVRDDFLSPAELSFYHVLRLAVAGWAVVCPKVALGDLLFAKTGEHGPNRSWMNRIDRQHVDFILCDPRTMRPLLGIELDDAGHQRPDRAARDRLVEEAFAAAKLPLARLAVRPEYNARELGLHLRKQATSPGTTPPVPATLPAAAPAPPAAPPAAAVPPGSGPACPKCGAPMVLRVVSKEGPQKGKHFWVCPQYPQCRGIRRIDDVLPLERS